MGQGAGARGVQGAADRECAGCRGQGIICMTPCSWRNETETLPLVLSTLLTLIMSTHDHDHDHDHDDQDQHANDPHHSAGLYFVAIVYGSHVVVYHSGSQLLAWVYIS